MHPTVVLNVVGLTPKLISSHTPHLQKLVRRGGMRPLRTILPAVTCSVQSTFLTGKMPCDHGIVGNGWYDRDLAEVLFWRQSNRLVQSQKVWDTAWKKDHNFTCANLFWWYNMYSKADFSVTPRPMYPADGRKIPDIYTQPSELREELKAQFGPFPLFHFWGPKADLVSSQWIQEAALHVIKTRQPTLTLIYLPHLDYDLQRLGPNDPRISQQVAQVDTLCGHLIDALSEDHRIVVLSEYGITEVANPIHINRTLRQAGWLRVREELGRELLDAGASDAFAVADHQIAHVYVSNPRILLDVKKLIASLPGVERVLDLEDQQAEGLNHLRSGQLIAVANQESWFTYYHWLDDKYAPDFAHTVDIHRKPGYDPVELFLDPNLKFPKLHIARRLLQKALGFRTLMDVIPLDANLVKGSHGRPTDTPDQGPVFISSAPELLPEEFVKALDVKNLILAHLFAN